MNDLFYLFEYVLMLRFLFGIEGVGVGWDVLEFLINEVYVCGIEVYVWMNFYCVVSGLIVFIED